MIEKTERWGVAVTVTRMALRSLIDHHHPLSATWTSNNADTGPIIENLEPRGADWGLDVMGLIVIGGRREVGETGCFDA